MKNLKRISIVICCIIWLWSDYSRIHAQDAGMLLDKSWEKCNAIEQGEYVMTRAMKYMSENDTSSSQWVCQFKKLPADTVMGFAFRNRAYPDTAVKFTLIYSGNELIQLTEKDSSATITPDEPWASHIVNIKHNWNFYDAIVQPKLSAFPDPDELHTPMYELSILGTDILNGHPCHIVRANVNPDSMENEYMVVLRNESRFWIDDETYLPLQYSVAYDMVLDNDTMYQYEMITLHSFNFHHPVDERIFQTTAIPGYFTVKAYEEYTQPEPLPMDSQAPTWKLISLDNDSIALEDLQGKVVLIDFFYRSCFPCMQAIPALQKLHAKYSDQGFQMIGIDPYDKNAPELKEFLSKRGVTYPILLSDKLIPESYHVSGYPTLYMLDQQGKIIFVQVGYGEDTEAKIESALAAQLSGTK